MTQKQVEVALFELKQKTEKWFGAKIDKVSLSVGHAFAEEYSYGGRAYGIVCMLCFSF